MILCADCGRQFPDANAIANHMRATHDNPEWHRTKAAKKASLRAGAAPLCPSCGSPARLSAGKWGIKAQCCGLWSWGGKPLVDRETHAARIRAHEAFDRTWKEGGLPRGSAYRRLAAAMGMTSDECHISLMTAEQARRVVWIMQRHFERTDA